MDWPPWASTATRSNANSRPDPANPHRSLTSFLIRGERLGRAVRREARLIPAPDASPVASPHGHWRLVCLLIAGEAIFALPFHLPRFFRPQLLEALSLSNTALGDAFALYGVVAMLAYFPGGLLADRYPARVLLATALWATALGGVLLASFPPPGVLGVLYAFWGLTTILLCWAALLRATREWGGPLAQGRAFGLLEAGRGAVAAILANLAVFVLARAAEAGLGDEAALRLVVLFYSLTVLAAGALCWILLPAGTLAETPSAAPRTSTPRALLRVPALGWHAALLVCAYCGYKSLDYATLYLDAALAIDADEASRLFSLSAWLRPVAALAAGYLADRIGISRMVSALFAVGALATVALAAGVTASLGLVMIEFALVVLVVCGLRGIYFALLEEMHLPRELTGTAIGFVSVVGYLPDVFFAPLAGRILDAAPGLPGFSRLYALLAAIFVAGLFCSQALRRQARVGG